MRLGKLYRTLTTYVNQVIGSSDFSRWEKESSLAESWNSRTKIIAKHIPSNSSVIEFGAGKMMLKEYLPNGCRYQPSDLVKRDENYLICNLNSKELPSLEKYDVAVFSGVLEYIHNVEYVLNHLGKYVDVIVASYAVTDRLPSKVIRRSHGWVNDFSSEDIIDMFENCNFSCLIVDDWNGQIIIKATGK